MEYFCFLLELQFFMFEFDIEVRWLSCLPYDFLKTLIPIWFCPVAFLENIMVPYATLKERGEMFLRFLYKGKKESDMYR